MSNLFQSRPFNVGILCGLVLLAAVNYYSYLISGKSQTSHSVQKFGFPFTVYEYGGSVTFERILWFGLIADILIAVIFSLIVGLIFKLIGVKFTTREFK